MTTCSSLLEEEGNVAKLCGSSRSKCGYCHGRRAHLVNAPQDSSSKSYSLLMECLTPRDYCTLLDRGWRRSGNHLYRPDNWNSCCPALPIRLPVANFAPNRSHRRVWRTMQRSLSQGHHHSEQTHANPLHNDGRSSQQPQHLDVLLERYRRATVQALSSLAAQYGISSEELYELARFKLTTRSLPKQQQQRQRQRKISITAGNNKENNHHKVMAFTAVCAAVSGRSRGMVNKFVCASLVLSSLQQQHNRLVEETKTTTIGVTLDSVNVHEKSGHVQLIFDIPPTTDDDVGHTQNSGEEKGTKDQDTRKKQSANDDISSSNHHDGTTLDSLLERKEISSTPCTISANGGAGMNFSNTTNGNNTNDKSKNKIKSTNGGAGMSFSNGNDTKNENNKKSEHAIFSEYFKFMGIPDPGGPYTLTVQSVPARMSAMRPEVHRLFVRYQSAIHKDPNPFLNNNNNSSSNHGAQSIITSHSTPTTATTNNTSTTTTNNNNRPKDNKVYRKGEKTKVGNDECLRMNNDESLVPDNTPIRMREGVLSKLDIDREYAQYPPEQRRKIYEAYMSFHRFLCEAPFPRHPPPLLAPFLHQQQPSNNNNNDRETMDKDDPYRLDSDGYDIHVPYGCYHQHYLLNSTYLIAVGVVDILPTCLSSVYAFYDPILSTKLNLGTYTALHEIEWVKRARIYRPELQYYYLGFYIQSCQKMRYKANYQPSMLLCPTHYSWIDFRSAHQMLRQKSPIHHCCTLTEDKDNNNNGSNDEETISTINDLWIDIGGGRLIKVGMLNGYGRDIVSPLITEFVQQVGTTVGRKCVVKLC